MNLVVSKFGGTSVGSAEAIRKVKKIIMEDPKRKVVVVSAVSGVTDLLIKSARTAKENGNWKAVLNEVRKKHKKIVKDLAIKLDLSIYFNELESILANINSAEELSPRNRDYVLSFGERLSSRITSCYLEKEIKTKRINARHIIKTDSTFGNAKVDFGKTKKAVAQNLIPNLKKAEKIITTGFIGANANGEYTTLSRGGSDYSAAVLASVMGAKELEIWTDVDGIMAADPKIIPGAKIVENISYAEAAELSYFGAKVLHPKTIKPVVKKNIPIRVLNTFNPKNPGTRITNDSPTGIKSISRKNSSFIISLYAEEMVDSYGFLANIFSIFLKYEMVADVVCTSEASISVTVDSRPPANFIKELEKYVRVSVLPEKTIICIVGQGINQKNNILEKIFSAIKEHPIRMISQNSFARNITLVVDKKDSQKIIEIVYRKIFKK